MKILQVKVFIVFMYMLSIFNKILKPLFLTILILTSSEILFSQSYKSSSKKAIKNYEKACHEFLNDNRKALMYAEKALSYDENYLDAILIKAELYLDMLSYDSLAMKSYERLFEIDSMAFPKSAISLSKLYMKYFRYDQAISLLNWFLSLQEQKETIRKIAEKELDLTEFRKNLYENPVNYTPKNIGRVINTSDDAYINQYHPSEEKIVFTNFHAFECKVTENVYVSSLMDSLWTMPEPLLENIDSYGYVGAANISFDGKEIYFSGCGWENGHGSCDIYRVEFLCGKWSEPQNINSINTSDWESQPCVSADGKELYFVRRDKKLGTSDIFVSYRNDNHSWTKAERLTSVINTEGNEMAPFVHHDGKTLYFSSDSHLGMGGYDLFVSRRDANGEWTQPVNLGYPLNSSGNEINLVVSNDAVKAFISANRTEGYGGFDIYEFELDDRFRPENIEIEKKSDEDYYLYALEKKQDVTIRNIYFKFDSADLTSESEEGINEVYDFLVQHPYLKIEIMGHTDDMGNADYNQLLSERRAESVAEALIKKGISSERIKTKGCGSTQPLFPNNFDELRDFNRRVSMGFSQ
ncbi:MAG: OmpA family protein [Bacteroidales bacterium]|nr:OmpA family protein [Bacteroidales bacterium]